MLDFALVCEMQRRCNEAKVRFDSYDDRARPIILRVLDDEIAAASKLGLRQTVDFLLDVRFSVTTPDLDER